MSQITTPAASNICKLCSNSCGRCKHPAVRPVARKLFGGLVCAGWIFAVLLKIEISRGNEAHGQLNRRVLLGGFGLGTFSFVQPGVCRTVVNTTCDPSEKGQECRMAELSKDSKRNGSGGFQPQSKETEALTNVPISVLDDAYVESTISLGNTITKYTSLDPYDPDRVAAIKLIKSEGPTWVSKYARGGSARKQSARRFYIVVDAVLGFIGANGIAPFPEAKSRKIIGNIEETKTLLEEGL